MSVQAQENTVAEALVASETSEGLSLLDQIVTESRVAVTDTEKLSARDQIGELVDEVLAGTVSVSMDLAASIDLRIAQLDEILSDQLNAIMHQPDFQQLEASWRGLKYLVMQSETSTGSLIGNTLIAASIPEASLPFTARRSA